MTALEDDPELRPVAKWNLPTDVDGFLAWLKDSGASWDEFKTYPAYKSMPKALRAAVGAKLS